MKRLFFLKSHVHFNDGVETHFRAGDFYHVPDPEVEATVLDQGSAITEEDHAARVESGNAPPDPKKYHPDAFLDDGAVMIPAHSLAPKSEHAHADSRMFAAHNAGDTPQEVGAQRDTPNERAAAGDPSPDRALPTPPNSAAAEAEAGTTVEAEAH
jgi:hypothetical protein